MWRSRVLRPLKICHQTGTSAMVKHLNSQHTVRVMKFNILPAAVAATASTTNKNL
jgi:hypothetical protein